MSSQYESYIWDKLYAAIANEIGTAALMGNLQAESGMIPYRKQGDFSSGYTASITYTNNVNNGTITENQFVHDSIGYGLAQWTYYTRKQKLYNKKVNDGYSSIGDVDLACDYLVEELQTDYNSVWNTLVNATDLHAASDVVLVDFENPADQSQAVKDYRASLGQAIYNTYAGGGPPTPPTPPGPPSPPTTLEIPIWMLFKFDN